VEVSGRATGTTTRRGRSITPRTGRRPSFEPRPCILKFTRKVPYEDRTVTIPARPGEVGARWCHLYSGIDPDVGSSPRLTLAMAPSAFPLPARIIARGQAVILFPCSPAPSARSRLLRQSETALCILPRPSRPSDGGPPSVPASLVLGFSKIVRYFRPLNPRAAGLDENGKIVACVEIRADAMPSGLTSRATGRSQAFQPSWKLVEIGGRDFPRASERLV
jgi:hypothetical protein